MANRIQIRRGTSVEWAAANPVLARGEMGFDTTLRYIKFGDGSTPWVGLPWLRPAPDAAVRTTIFQTAMSATPQSIANTSTWILGCAGGQPASAQSKTVWTNSFATFPIRGSDYAVTGKTTKLSLRAVINTNNTAPGNTMTFGLYQLSSPGTSTSVGLDWTFPPIGPVAGSTCSIVSPAANSSTTASSGTFTMPGDGTYVIGLQTSDLNAANSYLTGSVILQLSYA